MLQFTYHVIESCMTDRIANAPLCILFPLSPFSSQGSHNCKREGNYNLLSMILQIDIPFPLLMNTFTFSCFSDILWGNFNIAFIKPRLAGPSYEGCSPRYIYFIVCVHLWYLSLHKMCSSPGIYQPKSFHCPPVNPGSALIVTGVRQCWPLIGPWPPVLDSDWSEPSSIMVIMWTIRPSVARLTRYRLVISPASGNGGSLICWHLAGPLVPGIISWYKSDSDKVAKIRLTIRHLNLVHHLDPLTSRIQLCTR